ncbi:MAG: apolipoprotein N-acyltransferase [Betaproteobacteria bacterium]
MSARRQYGGAAAAPVRIILLPFLLGAATVAGFAPFYLYPLPILALSALLLLWERSRDSRSAAAAGFCFGLGMFLFGVSWVYVSLHDFGGMGMLTAAIFTFTFCAILACYPALVGALLERLPASRPVRWLLFFPSLWALSEWVRDWLFTGFPWLALGYSQAPASPLAGFAPLLGVFGVSLATAVAAAALASIILRVAEWRAQSARRPMVLLIREPGVWVIVALLAAGIASGGRDWTQALPGEPTSVALLQGNIAQDMKWRPERARATLETYLRLAQSAEARLILLPETALPMFNVDVPADYLEMLAARGRHNGGDLLVGVPELEASGRYYNSVMSLGSAPTQIYRKHHLVPFGDYFPLRSVLGWIMNLLHIPMSDFSRGEPVQPPIQAAGQKIAVNICYEDAFGEEIIRQLPEATVLANFTNDAWWGKSVASKQHLQIAQMRAIETGRPMLRATNTGVTAIIDPKGRVTASAAEFTTTVVNGEIRGYQGATPYVRLGNWAFLAAAALMIGLPLATRRFSQPAHR